MSEVRASVLAPAPPAPVVLVSQSTAVLVLVVVGTAVCADVGVRILKTLLSLV
jgi:hypothetical protein